MKRGGGIRWQLVVHFSGTRPIWETNFAPVPPRSNVEFWLNNCGPASLNPRATHAHSASLRLELCIGPYTRDYNGDRLGVTQGCGVGGVGRGCEVTPWSPSLDPRVTHAHSLCAVGPTYGIIMETDCLCRE